VKGFKEFVWRGNAVDLAVAVVLAAAFTMVIGALVSGIINPLIAAIFGKPNLDDVGTFTINGAFFSIGVVLTAVINFVLVAAAVYFVIVLPMNKFREMQAKDETAPPTEIDLLTEIRDALQQRNSGA